MKTFYIPKFNIGFKVPNKSGSLQIINTFKLFLDLKSIPYTTESYIPNEAKLFILVRNPIDRFITTYNWFMVKDLYSDLKKELNITCVDDFIKKYDEILNKINHDTHIAPQIFSLSNRITILKTSKKDLEKEIAFMYENIDYEFIHMEKIAEIHDEFMKTYEPVHQTNSVTNISVDGKCILNLFSSDIFSGNDKFMFEVLYEFSKSLLNTHKHHKHSSQNINNIIEFVTKILKIEILQDELELYGYVTKDKKNVI